MTIGNNVWVVIPNWNGADFIAECLKSLVAQTQPSKIVVVDNGSIDNSIEIIESGFPDVEIVKLPKNTGFAGGVNSGIRHAIKKNADAVALFNSDAVASKSWLKDLVEAMNNNPQLGIVTGKLLGSDRVSFDSTGEGYSVWGLPYPRGRGEKDNGQYDKAEEVFAASGGASLYRAEMLEQIGLFDDDFFAYYEDIDLSFRAQLAGWKVWYEPRAIVFHETGSTSRRIKGFTTYQTIKNLPWLLWKNVPASLLWRIWPRFFVAHLFFMLAALQRRQFWPVLKGLAISCFKFPKKLLQRHKIQAGRKVNVDYIKSLITYDLPPNASRLRKFRRTFGLKY